jgi:uncharacterized membrane protein YhaH (DUF805 family)
MNYYISALKKYAVFEGRAQRAEYWYFLLFNTIISIAIFILTVIAPKIGSILTSLYLLVLIVPSISVTVRRLHDTGRSGWWWFVRLIPFIGAIVSLIFMLLDSQPGQNKYGQNPKEMPSA